MQIFTTLSAIAIAASLLSPTATASPSFDDLRKEDIARYGYDKVNDCAFLDSKIELGGIEKKVSEDKSLHVLHPADLNSDWRLVMSEAILSLSGWQHGSVPISEAVRAAYLWQNGEQYAYDSSASAPLCWVLKSSDYYNPSLARQITPMVVENPDYPESPVGSGLHPCTIWTPNGSAVSAYKNGVFIPSRLISEGKETASLSDVVDTRQTYGYRSSSKPPRFIPSIDYSSYGEDPLFSFVGQMIPGTNVQYTDPAIPPVWLVDLKDVDNDGTLDTIPALTTIDFTKFMSINWPRERYMEAIEKTLTGTEGVDYERLSGNITEPNLTLSGIYKVTGDVNHQHGDGNIGATPGTVLVMTAKQRDYDTGFGYPNIDRILFAFWGNHAFNGTEQRPIIWTSDAISPAGNDWQMVSNASNFAGTHSRNLMEYARICFQNYSPQNPEISNNIMRYTEGDYTDNTDVGGAGILSRGTDRISDNELHNNSNGVILEGPENITFGNEIYNNTINIGNPRGIFTGQNRVVDCKYNIIIKCPWGIAPEDGSTNNIYIHNNISTFNELGVIMFWDLNPNNPTQYSNPLLKNNNVWNNKAPHYVTGSIDGFANYVKGQGQVTYEYDLQNTSNNPNFRNVKIYDLVHDTDNDGLFSDVESNSGIYTSPTDTGTDPWNSDSDDDGLLDGVETGTGIYNGPNDTGSDPNNWDTDEDGVDDGTEVQLGYNPVDPDDTPVLPEGEGEGESSEAVHTSFPAPSMEI